MLKPPVECSMATTQFPHPYFHKGWKFVFAHSTAVEIKGGYTVENGGNRPASKRQGSSSPAQKQAEPDWDEPLPFGPHITPTAATSQLPSAAQPVGLGHDGPLRAQSVALSQGGPLRAQSVGVESTTRCDALAGLTWQQRVELVAGYLAIPKNPHHTDSPSELYRRAFRAEVAT